MHACRVDAESCSNLAMPEPFDPLAVENVGVTLAVELLERPAQRMPLGKPFPGAGVYAIYYHGESPAYAPLVALDKGGSHYPIYIGSAVRENAKQGFTAKPTTKAKIHARLSTHQRSIIGGGLDPALFSYRYLVLNDAYITLAESVLIAVFRPVWNGMGFGSNGVGGPRMSGDASLWDALHAGRPGRPAADAVRRAAAAAHIAASVARIGAGYDDPRTGQMAARVMRFIEGRAAAGQGPSVGA